MCTIRNYLYGTFWLLNNKTSGPDKIGTTEIGINPDAAIFSECYTGDGSTYRGGVFRTDRGTLCQPWTESPKINPTTHPDKVRNFCLF